MDGISGSDLLIDLFSDMSWCAEINYYTHSLNIHLDNSFYGGSHGANPWVIHAWVSPLGLFKAILSDPYPWLPMGCGVWVLVGMGVGQHMVTHG